MNARRVIAFLPAIIALACQGNPVGPSSAGTVIVDGQTIQGTDNGSGAFSRAPFGLDWLDLTITTCSSAPGITMTIKGVTHPPAPGVYAVSSSGDVVGANASISGQSWHAGEFYMTQYCGRTFGAVVLPACTDTSPGSGSVTINSASSERVTGSYRFVMMQLSNYSGHILQRPPAVTKVVEGSFDLVFGDDPLCG